jgi:hypothetical protein
VDLRFKWQRYVMSRDFHLPGIDWTDLELPIRQPAYDRGLPEDYRCVIELAKKSVFYYYSEER